MECRRLEAPLRLWGALGALLLASLLTGGSFPDLGALRTSSMTASMLSMLVIDEFMNFYR